MRFYREFRQDRGMNGRGKTQWPEPDEIRAIRQRQEMPGPEGFPRGALGLPIVFHFKDHQDPSDQILNIEEPDGRMASPVILRPFAISREQALPLILVLNAETRPLHLHDGRSSLPVNAGRRNAIDELVRKAQDRWQASATRI